MTESLISLREVVTLLESSGDTFPSREELLDRLRRLGDHELLFRTSHSASLANSLEIKYRVARDVGVGVEGLGETVACLRALGGTVINTLIEDADRFFLVMLDREAMRIVGLIRVLPLINGSPQVTHD